MNWLTSLFGGAGLTAAMKYLLIALAVIIGLLVTTVLIEYAVIKSLQADKVKLTAALKECELKKDETARVIIDKDAALADLQKRCTECTGQTMRNIEECLAFTELLKKGCAAQTSRCESGWRECEEKLKNCGGGVNEDCEDSIKRRITPYLYSLP
jgi:hypothetical protein